MTDKQFQRKLERAKKRGERLKQRQEIEQAYMQYLPDKKKKKVSNMMLIIIVIAIVGYVVADFVLQYKMGVEISSTITTCWFAFWTAEILALTGIKVSKVKHGVSSALENLGVISSSMEEDVLAEDASDNSSCG